MHRPTLRLHISNQGPILTSKPSLEASTTTPFAPLLSLTNLSMTTPTLASPRCLRGNNTHTDTCNTIASIMDTSPTTTTGAMGIHRGAIDNTTITTQPPLEVMTKVRGVLDSIGVSVEPQSAYKFRCIRPSQSGGGSEVLAVEGSDSNIPGAETPAVVIYADDPSRDPAGEVRFSVELTRLVGLSDTYCLDIRRLKGNLRSYQFLYETIRDRAHLTA